MLDWPSLVHKGGRVYDPQTGRFLSADPHIQEAANSQSYNRYSYVLNNPLSYTDPTGFFLDGLVKIFFKAIKFVGGLFISAVNWIGRNWRIMSAKTPDVARFAWLY